MENKGQKYNSYSYAVKKEVALQENIQENIQDN